MSSQSLKYGLISTSLDRLMLAGNDYKSIKLTQMIISRFDLFYIADLQKTKNISQEITDKNYYHYTLSGAKRFHLELDIEIDKLTYREIIKSPNDLTNEIISLVEKIKFVHDFINQFEKIDSSAREKIHESISQNIEGLKITKEFLRTVMGNDQDMFYILDRDITEAHDPIKHLDSLKQTIYVSLLDTDYSRHISEIKNDLRESIKGFNKLIPEIRVIKKTLINIIK